LKLAKGDHIMPALQILVIHSDSYHAGSLIKGGLEFLRGLRHSLTFISDPDKIAASKFSDFDMLFLCKANQKSETDNSPWMDEKTERQFLCYVRQGGGLVIMHSGLAGYERQHKEFAGLAGGYFVRHPLQTAVAYIPVSGSEITNGADAFTCKDEQYFIEFVTSDAQVFMESQTSEYKRQPAGWFRAEGKGLAPALTPGHNPEVWASEGYHVIIGNSINFIKRRQTGSKQ
jgi:type 1 glutamine amidotransferase